MTVFLANQGGVSNLEEADVHRPPAAKAAGGGGAGGSWTGVAGAGTHGLLS